MSTYGVGAFGTSGSTTDLPLTVADLIAATKDHLQGTYRSEWNALSAACQPADTTLSFTGPIGGASRTAYLAVEDEIVYVQSSVASPAQATVIRGFDGTVAAAHTAGTLVEVSPRFPAHSIRRQLALEIASWPHNLFQVAQTSFMLDNDGMTFAYDIGVTSAQFRYLLDLRHAPWSATNRNTWPPFSLPPKVNRSVDVATFPSGMALEIPCVSTGGGYEIVGAVEAVVTYATPFNLIDMSDTTPVAAVPVAAQSQGFISLGQPISAISTFGGLPVNLPAGASVTLSGGGNSQTFITSTAVPFGTTSIPVVTQSANAVYNPLSAVTASIGLGLSTSMLDIPPLGAAYRLMGPREALRTFGEAMDQQRSTQDVPAGAAMKIASWLKDLRDQRIAEEIEHLNVAWPMRMK